MTFKSRVKKYLKSLNYKLVEIDDGMVYYRDKNDKVWGARECAVARDLKEWESE